MIFSGREHVARGKPAPDLYLHAAAALGVPIERIAIIEDSPVGVEGALASGAEVIGLVAGRHCLAGHAERLRALGVRHIARDFDEVAAIARLELVAASVALGRQIGAVVLALADFQRHVLGNRHAGRLQRRHLAGIVGQQPDHVLRDNFASIRAATAKSRSSSWKPSRRLASTVSKPWSCSA